MGVRLLEKTASAYSFPLLIKNLLIPALRYAPHQEIVYRDKFRYDYQVFSSRIAQLAHTLGDVGVSAGDTVAVIDWDSHRYLECYFGVPIIGAILHTINFRLSPNQIAYTMNHAEDDVIILHHDFLPLLAQVRPLLDIEPKIILISDDGKSGEMEMVDWYVGNYEELLCKKSKDYTYPDFDENAVATIFYTTGTTGKPKGVTFSHRQLVMHTYGFMAGLCAFKSFGSVDSSDVYMPLTPMFHVHAWGMPYIFTMLGAKQVYPGRYEPARILALVSREGVTFSHCVPTIMQMLLADPAAKDHGLSGWKVVIGGSALSHGLCAEAAEYGINLFSAYGMSETCPLMTIAIPKPHMFEWSDDDLIGIRIKTGLPAPLVELEIVDALGVPLAHDGVQKGELVVRSPWLAQSYFKEPEKSEELWRDGWLHTGDVGVIDKDGYVQITDRIKDVIKTGGEWLSSLQLEDLISRHEAVEDVAVVGIPHDKWGERPIALVVVKPAFEDTVRQRDFKEVFTRYVAEGIIPKYGIPDQFLFVNSIAKTSVGKTNKKELRTQYKVHLINKGVEK
jgi:fatty-acyl-CoA synthase